MIDVDGHHARLHKGAVRALIPYIEAYLKGLSGSIVSDGSCWEHDEVIGDNPSPTLE